MKLLLQQIRQPTIDANSGEQSTDIRIAIGYQPKIDPVKFSNMGYLESLYGLMTKFGVCNVRVTDSSHQHTLLPI